LIGDLITDTVLTRGAVGEEYTRLELALATLGGSGLVRVKIWNNDGLIIYSDDRQLVGMRYEISPELQETLEGLTVAEISELQKDENIEERGFGELLEVYTPLRQGGKSEIVGAFEGYYDITDLRDKMDATNEFLWISIGFGFSFLYVSLFTLVRSASQRIIRQARENAVLLEDTERKAARLAVVNELARSINQSALDLEEVFQTALRGIDRIVPNNGASISLLDEQNGEVLDTVCLKESRGNDKARRHGCAELDIECARRLLAGADTYINGDASTINDPSVQSMVKEGTRSLLLVSISLGSRRLGLITLTANEKRAFGQGDADILKSVADQLAVAIENSWLIAETAETTALREANKLKDEFMSMVSHELRTPLASIKGYSRTLLAEDGHWDDQTRSEFLTIISDESDKLAELVENLLEMTRINGDRLKIMPEPVLLGRYCAEVVDRVSKHYPEIKFECEVSEKLPLVEADPRRLEQVLVNLLQNAAKYSKGEVIRVSADHDGDWGVVICVQDNGIGIPAEHLPHLFDKFYRVEAKGETGMGVGMGISAGTGLGLAISKALVEAQGGRIWVTSAPGKGTTFYFTVPVLRMPEEGQRPHKVRADVEAVL
jgi:signal transduction histidine kinase